MISRKDFTYDRHGQRDYAYRRPERLVSYRHKNSSAQNAPRFLQSEGESLPDWAEDVQPYEEAPMKPLETIEDDQPEQPAWTTLLPLLIASLESGTPAMKVLAKDELARMAELADQYAGLCR